MRPATIWRYGFVLAFVLSWTTSAWAQDFKPGDAPTAPAPPQLLDSGGPDAFGYTWLDSNEDGGPEYSFVDISGTGTALTGFDDEDCTFGDLDEGNLDVALPFDFPFYGGTYSQVTVNINGLIIVDTPDPLGCNFTDDPIPDTGTPNGGLIAPLWADYNATPNTEGGPNAGTIYTEAQMDGGDVTAFVIQFDGIERFGSSQNDLLNTFQVILYPDGNVLFQYGELQGTGSESATIGIENLDGTDGLQVARDQEYAANGLAVLMVAPEEGGGDPIALPVTFEDENVDYELTDFGGAESMLAEDPTDAENMVVQTLRPEVMEGGATCFAGTTVAEVSGFAEPIPFAPGETTMSVRVWSPEAGVRVLFKVEQVGNPGINVETFSFTSVAEEWETIVFDFANPMPNTNPINFENIYNKASIFYDFQCNLDPTATLPATFYWDDVAFGAPDMGEMTIAEARAAGSGATVTVTGTVTRAMGAFTYIQDETAGLTIRQTSGAFFDDVANGTISAGTEITVTGELNEFANLLQINEGNLASYEVGADGAVPDAQAVSLQEIVDNGESYEAELVTVDDLTTMEMGTFAAGTSYQVMDDTATDTLRVPNADDSMIDGTDIPEASFTFTGVIGQFSFDGPGLGYQLLAIAEGDVEADAGGDVATVDFEAQTSAGTVVVVASAFLPMDGYVAIHDSTLLDGNVAGSVIGVSEYLEGGDYSNIVVTLFDVPGQGFPADTMLTDDQTLIAMPHEETNGNMEYNFITSGGMEDGPYFVNNNPEDGPVIDDAFITIDADTGGTLVFNPSPLVEMLLTDETGTETVTISNTSDSEVMFDFTQYSGENVQRAPATSDQPTLDLEKGARDTRGYVQSFDAGGPDAFGYEWIDSNEPGGPAFENFDISATGTELTEADFDSEGCSFGPLDEGNALVELPFTFSYYGEDYTSLKVNINGNINLNADGAEIPCSFTNDPIPSDDAPNGGLIAPLWDDYDTGPAGAAGGQIFVETLSDGRFVVQWDNVEKFGSTNDGIPNTFQAILSPSGSIKFQYLDLQAENFSYSIGIENPDGTVGLEVAMGAEYAEEGLAVLIQARPSFVTGVSPATGTIPAGGTADVDVTFSAEGLIGGTYEGSLTVDTDLESDPSTFDLPVELEVTGVAECTLTPMALEFDDTIVGFSTSQEITVMNDGTDSCEIVTASADGPFSVEDFAAGTLDPGDSNTFTVVYTPTEAGDDVGTLTVALDGEDDLTADLSGTALAPPEFSVDPTSLSFEVEEGMTSDAQSVTLSNDGDGAGEFSITVSNTTPRGLPLAVGDVDQIVTVNGPEEAALLAQLARSTVLNARSNVTVTQRSAVNRGAVLGNAAAPEQPVFRGQTSGDVYARGGGSPGDLIASVTTTNSISGFGQTPDGTLYVCDLNAQAVTETFTYDVDNATFTPGSAILQPGTAGTNITGCTYYPDGNGGAGAIWYLNADLNNGTTTFIETDLAGEPTGATVPVSGIAAGATPIGLSYSEATGNFFLVDIGGDDIYAISPDGSVVDGFPVPQTCLDDGAGIFGNALDALGDGLDVIVGGSAAGRPDRVQVTEFDGSCREDEDGNDLFTPIDVTADGFINGVLRDRRAPNEVMFIGANSDATVYAVTPVEREDIGSFVVVSPESGSVDGGGDQEISVSIDASDLEPGMYSAELLIETNDPANPTLIVEIDVTVVQGPPSNQGDGVPTEFALDQNYPNPFAGATTIEYALPEAARVTITVYDAVGRRVAVLVDEDHTPGYHTASWDTRGLASGVYLYRIQAGDYVKTKKMSVVR